MTHQMQTTAPDRIPELLAENGFDGLAQAVTVLLNEVIVPAGAGRADLRSTGGPPRAEARELAEHGGDRAVGAGPAVPGPTVRDRRGAAAGGGGVVRGAERARHRSTAAVHDKRCPEQAPPTLTDTLILAVCLASPSWRRPMPRSPRISNSANRPRSARGCPARFTRSSARSATRSLSGPRVRGFGRPHRVAVGRPRGCYRIQAARGMAGSVHILQALSMNGPILRLRSVGRLYATNSGCDPQKLKNDQ
jgi:hypothetical protein